MRSRPVQECHVESDPTPRQPFLDYLRNFAGSGRYFQHGKMFHPGSLRHLFHHLLRGGDAAEPAVDAAEIPQRRYAPPELSLRQLRRIVYG